MQNPATPAPASTDPGFKLPAAPGAAAASGEQPAPPASGAIEVAPAAPAAATDTSARDLAIGGSVFLVLLIVYFFIRNAFVHHLVVRRVAPSSAGSAGWLMFLGLSFLSAAAVLAMIDASKFLTWAITGPLVAVGVLSLAATALVGRR